MSLQHANNLLCPAELQDFCGSYVVPCLPCGTMWLLCGSPLCGPPPPPPVNLHLNVSQAFVLDRPPPPSVYWSRFFDNFPGLSNIWGSAGPPRVLMTMVPWFELSCESVLWVWEQTVGFVTAKWLYLRCWPSSPLWLGTILTSTQLIPGSQNMVGRPCVFSHNCLKIRNAFKLTSEPKLKSINQKSYQFCLQMMLDHSPKNICDNTCRDRK